MKPVFFLLLSAALAVLIVMVGVVLLWAGGARTVLLPGLRLALSIGVLLVILTLLETVLILLTIMIRRS